MQNAAPRPQNSPLPGGVGNCYVFAFFNAVAFQIFLGAPIILYAKTLGAGPVVLGVLASLTPLLTVMQIPGAHYMTKTGYKRLMLFGWGSRNIFVLLAALLPLLAFLDDQARIVLLLAAAFAFNLSRGFTSGAWMPWISDLIPEQVRGRYLGREQLCTHCGSLFSMLICALLLQGEKVAQWQFSAVIAVSFASGITSWLYLRRVPETTSQEVMRTSSAPVPWGAMIKYPPFLKLVLLNALFAMAIGSLGVFQLSFLRSNTTLTETQILLVSATSFLAAVIASTWTGPLVDRVGSRPIMRTALGIFCGVLAAWFLWAADIVPGGLGYAVGLFMVTGIAGSSFALANVRLAMMTMPPMGRNHFYAIFTVITSLSLGLSPILWGVLLESLRDFDMTWGGLRWREFSVYFLGLGVLTFLTYFTTFSLHENRLTPDDRITSIVSGNLRRLWRLWVK